MHFYILFFATLVVGSYSQSFSTNASEKSLSRQRREFWNDVINEVSDDVNGAQSCVSAMETFVAENPEVLALAKRSIAEHILSKRGVVQFVKKWYNKLNPIRYFYDCFMFLKDKGFEIYNAIEHPEDVKKEFSEGYKETAEILSELYNGSLTNMIQSVDKVKSHLNHSEGNGNSDEKVLYKTISQVQSNLVSYATRLRKEDVEKVFLDMIKVFPRVGNSLSTLDWDSLTTLQLSSSPSKVRMFAEDMQHFDIAQNIMLIMNNASKFYPKFVAEEYPYSKDLAAGASCISFLLNTTEVYQTTNLLSNIGKLQYLELARKCGAFVAAHTTDNETSTEKSAVLTEKFFESIEHSARFLAEIEYYFLIVEKPVQPTEDERELLRATKRIKKYLHGSMTKKTKKFVEEAFGDIVPALEKVEAITSDWSLLKEGKKEEDTTFAPGSYFHRLIDLLKQFAVIPNVQTAKSFLKVMSFASVNPFLATTWFVM